MFDTKNVVVATAGVILAVVGAVGTFVASWQFWGFAGSLIVFGATCLAVAAYAWLQSRPAGQNLLAFNARYVTFAILAVGVLFVISGLVLYWGEWARITFGRANFTHEKAFLRLDTVDQASKVFDTSQIPQLAGNSALQAKFAKQLWVRWMADRFANPIGNDRNKTVLQSLVFFKSRSLDDNYDNFKVWPEVDCTQMKLIDAVAFLVDEGDERVWYRPRFRQMDIERIGEERATPLIDLNQPNKGESLWLFLVVENKNDSSARPDLKRCFPNTHHFEAK